MFQLRFKDLFDSASAQLGQSYTMSQSAMNIVIAMICGVFIYFIYRKTFSGVLFSRNLGITMIIVTVITSLIVMAIHGNLALSLGMIGALSIVRFRTPIKDPKDLAFLFWAIATGVICGISSYQFAFLSVVLVGGLLFILSKRMPWSSFPYLLVIKLNDSVIKDIGRILESSCERHRERSSTITHEATEIVYEVVLRDMKSVDLLTKLKGVTGVERAVMVSYDGELDESR